MSTTSPITEADSLHAIGYNSGNGDKIAVGIRIGQRVGGPGSNHERIRDAIVFNSDGTIVYRFREMTAALVTDHTNPSFLSTALPDEQADYWRTRWVEAQVNLSETELRQATQAVEDARTAQREAAKRFVRYETMQRHLTAP